MIVDLVYYKMEYVVFRIFGFDDLVVFIVIGILIFGCFKYKFNVVKWDFVYKIFSI